MPLKNISIPYRAVKVGDGEISVRGISLSDLMTIVNVYGPQASMAFSRIQRGDSLESSDVRVLIGTLAQEFPDMFAAAIALAADEYDAETIDMLKKVPFHKQIEVIEAIFSLTFTSEGEIKKLLESLSEMLAEVSGALMTVRLPSSIGIGESVAQ